MTEAMPPTITQRGIWLTHTCRFISKAEVLVQLLTVVVTDARMGITFVQPIQIQLMIRNIQCGARILKKILPFTILVKCLFTTVAVMSGVEREVRAMTPTDITSMANTLLRLLSRTLSSTSRM